MKCPYCEDGALYTVRESALGNWEIWCSECGRFWILG